jgi:hypothetical protein
MLRTESKNYTSERRPEYFGLTCNEHGCWRSAGRKILPKMKPSRWQITGKKTEYGQIVRHTG